MRTGFVCLSSLVLAGKWIPALVMPQPVLAAGIEAGLVRRLPAKARTRSPDVIETIDVSTDGSPGLRDIGGGPEVHLLVFDRSPQLFNKEIVLPGSFTIHADGDLGMLQNLREGQRGEMRSLISIENVRLTETGESSVFLNIGANHFKGGDSPSFPHQVANGSNSQQRNSQYG